MAEWLFYKWVPTLYKALFIKLKTLWGMQRQEHKSSALVTKMIIKWVRGSKTHANNVSGKQYVIKKKWYQKYRIPKGSDIWSKEMYFPYKLFMCECSVSLKIMLIFCCLGTKLWIKSESNFYSNHQYAYLIFSLLDLSFSERAVLALSLCQWIVNFLF